jgi:formylglycine-generating enzyme required for sulfatase activity
MEILLGIVAVLLVFALLLYIALVAVALVVALSIWLVGELVVAMDCGIALVMGGCVDALRLVGRLFYGCAGFVGGVFRVDVARERLSAVDAAWRMDVGLAPSGPLPDWCLPRGERLSVLRAGEGRIPLPQAARAHLVGGERRTVSGHGLSAFTFDVAYIPPGEFEMGSPNSEVGRFSDEDLHHVRLTRGFELGVVPVTQALYGALMGTNPSGCNGDPVKLPVESISWFDAVRFCNAVSRGCGLPEAYNIGAGPEPTVSLDRASGGFRLPTEAEWEYAARAGTRHLFAGGDDLGALGWFQGNSGGRTQAVGQKRANGWGLHDISGNVWEWCWDWRGAYPSGRVVDPVGPASGSNRVFRGGSWRFDPQYARVAFRYSFPPGYRNDGLGVRLLRTVT